MPACESRKLLETRIAQSRTLLRKVRKSFANEDSINLRIVVHLVRSVIWILRLMKRTIPPVDVIGAPSEFGSREVIRESQGIPSDFREIDNSAKTRAGKPGDPRYAHDPVAALSNGSNPGLARCESQKPTVSVHMWRESRVVSHRVDIEKNQAVSLDW